jgi:DNA repair protein RecO (recombination protein O)
MYDTREGLVLRSVKYKESDLILTVLTADAGKVTVTARGARRKNSPLTAASQLFVYSRMTLHRRSGHLHLKEAEILGLFDGLRGDIERVALAGWIAELAGALAVEDSSSMILSLTLGALYALAQLRKPPDLVKAAFELRLMAVSGFMPQLDGCAVCGKEDPNVPSFDCENGALYCLGCTGGIDVTPLTADVLAAVRHTVHKDPKRLYAFALNPEALPIFARAAEQFVKAHLDADFPALAFYHNIRSTPS